MIGDPEAVENDQASWLAVTDVLSRGSAAPRILPADHEKALASLRQLHVAAASPLGAIALNSGGILLYDGWLRIFGGSPCPEVCLPSIAQINAFPAHLDLNWTPTRGLIVAHDVLGGAFLLNGLRPGPGRPGVPGEVIYFDPASLSWTRMRMSHSEWLAWCVSGELPHFYDSLLWPGWRDDVKTLRADQGIAVSPSLWSDAAATAEGEVSRSLVSMAEILALQFEAAQQRGQLLDDVVSRYPAAGLLG